MNTRTSEGYYKILVMLEMNVNEFIELCYSSTVEYTTVLGLYVA